MATRVRLGVATRVRLGVATRVRLGVAARVRLGLAAAAACLLLASARNAQANLELHPPLDGSLGVWLSAGPMTAESAARALRTIQIPSLGEPISPGGGSWRLLHTARGALDLRRKLNLGKKSGAVVLLSGVVVLRRKLNGWLLISADGSATARVSGRQVWSKAATSLRGHAWDVIPLKLDKGRHSIVLRLTHPGRHFAVAVRIIDREHLLAPPQMTVSLPGVAAKTRERLLEQLLSAELLPGLSVRGYAPRLELSYRRGAPGSSLPVTLTLSGAGAPQQLSAGVIPNTPHGLAPLSIRLPRTAGGATATGQRLKVTVRVGTAARHLELALDPQAAQLLLQAQKRITALRSQPQAKLADSEVIASTLQYRSRQLTQATSRREVAKAAQSLRTLLSALDDGRDPLREPGLVALARASVDGDLDPLLLHIPRGSGEPGARLPLVVALHGMNGSPEGIVRAFLNTHHTGPSVSGFVLAPHAHGNAFYRGPGERTVLDALEWALKTLPIDPDRVSITGVSMGGTGTAHIAFRHAGRFAAAAPLCGYHSYFIRRDTSDRSLTDWEKQRMHHWSPTSWADNGNNLPLWVAHGKKDFPLENSRVLIDRYRTLGYKITAEWPDTGHAVWEESYAGARLFNWLSRQRREPQPRRVVLKSDALRFARRAWVTITRLAQPARMAQIDARVSGPERLTIKTKGVHSFTLKRPRRHVGSGALEVEIDGERLRIAPQERLAFRRRQGGWEKGAERSGRGHKRAGLEGPIRDVFYEPLLFTYGTGSEHTRRANREVAEAWAQFRNGPDVRYRVLPDFALDHASEQSHAVVAVGTADDHLLLRSLRGKLPIEVKRNAVVFGTQRFAGAEVGATYISENPRAPGRYLLVITGNGAAGIWRALSLPRLLPDFVVYDATLGPAAAEQVLSAGKVLAAGFFDQRWQPPPSFGGPRGPK